MLTLSSTDRVFILAGAGLSAESGIPTFRGVGGFWRNYRIEEVASPDAWDRDPQLVWEFYSMRRRVTSAAKPNPAHFALANLEGAFILMAKGGIFRFTSNMPLSIRFREKTHQSTRDLRRAQTW
jgi:NAD-dependent SIR2 family protein deacetylase